MRLSSTATSPANLHQAKHMKLLAILFWATLAAYALATFLDPAFPGILEIIDNPKF